MTCHLPIFEPAIPARRTVLTWRSVCVVLAWGMAGNASNQRPVRSLYRDQCLAASRRICWSKTCSAARWRGLPSPGRARHAPRGVPGQSCRCGKAWCAGAGACHGRGGYQGWGGHCGTQDKARRRVSAWRRPRGFACQSA